MSDQKLPPGWDEARIREVIDHYDSQDEDERAAEIEAAWEAEGMTLMSVPTEMVPEIRAARRQADCLARRYIGPSLAGGPLIWGVGAEESQGCERPTIASHGTGTVDW